MSVQNYFNSEESLTTSEILTEIFQTFHCVFLCFLMWAVLVFEPHFNLLSFFSNAQTGMRSWRALLDSRSNRHQKRFSQGRHNPHRLHLGPGEQLRLKLVQTLEFKKWWVIEITFTQTIKIVGTENSTLGYLRGKISYPHLEKIDSQKWRKQVIFID